MSTFATPQNLTKRDIVVRISEETGMTQLTVLHILQKMLDHMIESLASGRNIEIRNWGVLEVRVTKARIGRNPKRPETDVQIPPRAVVKFKQGKEMKAKMQSFFRNLEEPSQTPPAAS